MSSKIILTYTGTTKNGNLKIRNKEAFVKEVLKCFPESEIQVTVKKKGRKRSGPQNSFYWCCVVADVRNALIEAGNSGITLLDVHEFLKQKFNPRLIANKDGEVMEIGATTTTLTRTEFGLYIDGIKEWARDFLNITIREPFEQVEIEFKE